MNGSTDVSTLVTQYYPDAWRKWNMTRDAFGRAVQQLCRADKVFSETFDQLAADMRRMREATERRRRLVALRDTRRSRLRLRDQRTGRDEPPRYAVETPRSRWPRFRPWLVGRGPQRSAPRVPNRDA